MAGMRSESASMALRFLDAIFSGRVQGEVGLHDGFTVKVYHRGLTHEVFLAADLLDWEPTAVMAPLRQVPTLLRDCTQAVRIMVSDTGLRVESLAGA